MDFIQELSTMMTENVYFVHFPETPRYIYFVYNQTINKIKKDTKSIDQIRKEINLTILILRLQTLCDMLKYNVKIHNFDNDLTYSFFYNNDEFEYELEFNSAENLFMKIKAQIHYFESFKVIEHIKLHYNAIYQCPNLMFGNSNGGYILNNKNKFGILGNKIIIEEIATGIKTEICIDMFCLIELDVLLF